jgi:hypothetical protein
MFLCMLMNCLNSENVFEFKGNLLNFDEVFKNQIGFSYKN